jgi:CheY-like chemotaxis protein
MGHFAGARVLVVDDEPDVLDAYQQVLKRILLSSPDELEALTTELFADQSAERSKGATIGAIDFCRQGEDAVRQIKDKLGEGNYYPVAFVDIRMPPGIDGLETAKRLRQVHPSINIVIVTGYSDHTPAQIAQQVGRIDGLFYLVKPFHPDEILQLAVTLIHRGQLEKLGAEERASMLCKLESATAQVLEREEKAQQLEKRIQSLLEQQRRANNRGLALGMNLEIGAAFGLPPLDAVSSEDHLSTDVNAAFDNGRTTAIRAGNLSHCPYSALKDADLFLAWIAGFRSA